MFNRESYPERHTAQLINQIEEMLKQPEFLEGRDHFWVQNIDKTAANFIATSRMTPRQEEVIKDIYARFVARRKNRA